MGVPDLLRDDMVVAKDQARDEVGLILLDFLEHPRAVVRKVDFLSCRLRDRRVARRGLGKRLKLVFDDVATSTLAHMHDLILHYGEVLGVQF